MKKFFTFTILLTIVTLNGCNVSHTTKPETFQSNSEVNNEDIKQKSSNQELQNKASNKKIKIVTSFYPSYEIAQKVGNEKAEVINLSQPGVEPHDFEPTPQDILTLQNADLIILNGANLEPWAEKMKKELSQKEIKIIDFSTLLQEEGSLRKEENGELDPHFWLDPVHYLKEIDILTKQLQTIDPVNKDYYQGQSENYKKEILKLHEIYSKTLQDCSKDFIVTNHEAFKYLGQRYNFETINISGISPESEPTAKDLAELSKLLREKNTHYVFTETLLSPKVADTLAKEIGAKTLVLNPLENLTSQEIKRNENYKTIMESNLKNLQIALECQGS